MAHSVIAILNGPHSAEELSPKEATFGYETAFDEGSARSPHCRMAVPADHTHPALNGHLPDRMQMRQTPFKVSGPCYAVEDRRPLRGRGPLMDPLRRSNTVTEGAARPPRKTVTTSNTPEYTASVPIR